MTTSKSTRKRASARSSRAPSAPSSQRSRARTRSSTQGKQRGTRYWSGEVTAHSNALDLEQGVFKRQSPRAIARSLKRSADKSQRRKASPLQSAMSMLNFYINRAGKGLGAAQRSRLQAAKSELRALYGRPRH